MLDEGGFASTSHAHDCDEKVIGAARPSQFCVSRTKIYLLNWFRAFKIHCLHCGTMGDCTKSQISMYSWVWVLSSDHVAIALLRRSSSRCG